MSEQDGKHSETNASGPRPRLEDRLAQAVKAFEGLNGAEVTELLQGLVAKYIGPKSAFGESVKAWMAPFVEDFRAAKKELEEGKSNSMRLHELCVKKAYGKPQFLYRVDGAKHTAVVTVTFFVENLKTKTVVRQATRSSRREASEAACRSVLEALTAK